MMLKFLRIDENLIALKEYFKKTEVEFCDISVGTRFLWRKQFKVDYAIFDDTLILKESTEKYSNAFYYPIGKNISGALEQIECYCLQENIPLLFCCIDNEKALKLADRYCSVEIYNDRAWSDYIYSAQDLITLKGKKLSGKRNHINKFKNTYPSYSVIDLKCVSENELKQFFFEYEEENLISANSLEKIEIQSVNEYIHKLQELEQEGIAIKVEGKIIGVSAGERLKETLIVHVEKALKKYPGIYPMLANEFAKRFAFGLKKINREEDCGDMGLRISKLQYHPIEIKQKNFVGAKTLFDKIVPPVRIKTERLEIVDILESDKKDYFRLYTDDELNKYWGYDYRAEAKSVNEDYFYSFQKSLKDKKEEYSLAVKLDGQFIGELVLYNFGFKGEIEIGFRFLPEFQKQGYAMESASGLISYTRDVLGARTIKCRAFKNNYNSLKLIKKLGFKLEKENDEKYFFIKTQIK